MFHPLPMFHPLDANSVWVFDLDNTLYPHECDLFSHIDHRMTAFIADRLGLQHDAARALQKRYFMEHGTTLRGLMDRHDVAPKDFLDYVHDIALESLAPDPSLEAQLAALPGTKLIYTNGTVQHAERVLAKLGIAQHFNEIFDIAAARYVPKPEADAFAQMVARLAFDPRRAVMLDDMARNLAPAHALGMTTVWIDNGSEWGDAGADAPYIHHVAPDVGKAVATLLAHHGSG
ncbi:MAG: pyrimidine 5'-nucleotidase [Sphingomonadales bacterium]